MGQNNDIVGQVGSTAVFQKYTEVNEVTPIRAKRMSIFLEEAFLEIKEKGILGNAKFYLKKLDVAYNDGQFHSVQCYDEETADKGIWYLCQENVKFRVK